MGAADDAKLNYGFVCDKDTYTLNSYIATDTKCEKAATAITAAKAKKWADCIESVDIKSQSIAFAKLSTSQFATAAASTTVATAMKMTIAATAAYAATQW